ncbi:hypothetical protein C3446_17140 [Escherichia coli]|nr:hypothetical protein C5O97_23940 [Escherichia coli]ROX09052.1 hypothetical protein C3446_17140 [Escherichia coli]
MRGLLVALCYCLSHYHIHPISPDMILAITIITKVIITTLTGGIIHHHAAAVPVAASSELLAQYHYPA